MSYVSQYYLIEDSNSRLLRFREEFHLNYSATMVEESFKVSK